MRAELERMIRDGTAVLGFQGLVRGPANQAPQALARVNLSPHNACPWTLTLLPMRNPDGTGNPQVDGGKLLVEFGTGPVKSQAEIDYPKLGATIPLVGAAINVQWIGFEDPTMPGPLQAGAFLTPAAAAADGFATWTRQYGVSDVSPATVPIPQHAVAYRVSRQNGDIRNAGFNAIWQRAQSGGTILAIDWEEPGSPPFQGTMTAGGTIGWQPLLPSAGVLQLWTSDPTGNGGYNVQFMLRLA